MVNFDSAVVDDSNESHAPGSSDPSEGEDDVAKFEKFAASIKLGEDVGGDVTDDGLLEFFPGNYKMKSNLIPIEGSKEVDSDKGTVTYKLGIGLGRSDIFDSDTEWSKYKKMCKDFEEGRLQYYSMCDNFAAGKMYKVVDVDKFKLLPKLGLMGYAEYITDMDGNILSTAGSVGATAEWKGKISWQFFIPIGPVYAELAGGADLKGTVKVAYDAKTGEISISDSNIKVEPNISLEAGYGVNSLATIGLEGSAEIPIQVIPATKGEFSAKVALHAYLVFVIDYKKDLATLEPIELWDLTSKKTKAMSLRSMSLEDMLDDADSLQLADRSYAAETGAWNGGESPSLFKRLFSLFSAQSESSTELTLQEGVMPQTVPLIEEVDGKKVVVFQRDNLSRSGLNSTELVYSVCTDGVWSEPRAVWDTGTLDAYADLKVINGTLYCAWQKEKGAISGDLSGDTAAVLTDMAAKSEICLARFDSSTGTFVDAEHVTNNDTLDMMPRLCAGENGAPAVTFVSNSSNDLSQASGTNSVMQAVKVESGWDAAVKYSTQDYFADIACGADGKVACVTLGADGYKVSVVAPGEAVALEGESSVPTSLQWTAGGNLLYLCNGTLCSFDPATSTTAEITAGESAIGTNVQYNSINGKTTVVWSESTENTKRVCSSVEVNGSFSEPVVLYESEEAINYLDFVMGDDGRYSFILNQSNTDGAHSLKYVSPDLSQKVVLEGVSACSPETPDGFTFVTFSLKNNSESKLYGYNWEVRDENGAVVSSDWQYCELEPGDTITSGACCDTYTSTNGSNLTFVVRTDSQSPNETNSMSMPVANSNFALSLSANELEDNVEVTAEIKNKMSVSSTAALTVRDGDENGTILHSETVTAEMNEPATVRFTISKSAVSYDKTGKAVIRVNVAGESADFDESDNTDFVVLYKQTSDEGPSGPSDSGNTGGSDNPGGSGGSGNPGGSGSSAAGPGTAPSPVPTPDPEPEPAPVDPDPEPERMGAGATFEVGGIAFTILAGSKTVSVKAASGGFAGKTLRIPAVVKDANGFEYKVTKVAANAFKNCTSIKKLVISEGIIAMGAYAFKGCTKLESVTLPKSLTTIERSVFSGCKKLIKLTIPAKVKEIGKYAFYNSGIKTLTIKSAKLTQKGLSAKALTGSNIKTVKVPESKLKAYKKLFTKSGCGRAVTLRKL